MESKDIFTICLFSTIGLFIIGGFCLGIVEVICQYKLKSKGVTSNDSTED